MKDSPIIITKRMIFLGVLGIVFLILADVFHSMNYLFGMLVCIAIGFSSLYWAIRKKDRN